MPTVNISAAVDKMMKNMISDTMESCVSKLSEKYGFDEKEALEFLEIDGLKEKRKTKRKRRKRKRRLTLISQRKLVVIFYILHTFGEKLRLS